MTHWLGIDYGTSNTVAVLRWPDGRTRPLLFDGSPMLPSAVYAAGPDQLLVGRDAERQARLDPARFELNPKRRVDDGELLLADVVLPVTGAVAATLRRVWGEAVRTAGSAPGRVVMTYPAAWGARRRSLLVDAAAQARLPQPTLVPEPVAAAAYFATVLGHRVPVGGRVVVYDLGAGTFDVSVVRRDPDGYSVIEVDGMPDFGGADLDAILVDQVRRAIEPTAAEAWHSLSAPQDTASRRAFRLLWDDARGTKETLSRQASVGLHVPLVDRDVVLSREDFEAAAAPALERAARLTATVIQQAQVGDSELAGLFLVGGSSRVPLVATTLHRATGLAPTVIEQPEMVVAEGAVHSVRSPADAAPAPTALPAAPQAPPGSVGTMTMSSAGPPTAMVPPPPPPGPRMPQPVTVGPSTRALPPPMALTAGPPPVNPERLPRITPLPTAPVRKGRLVLALLGIWLPVLVPLVAFTMPVPVTFFAMYESNTNALDGMALVVVWLLIFPLLVVGSIVSAIWLRRLVKPTWPTGTKVFTPGRGWLAGLSIPVLVLGVVAGALGLEMLRGIYWSADAPKTDGHREDYNPDHEWYTENSPTERLFGGDHTELFGLAVVGLLLAAVGMVGLLLYRRFSHPRLALTPNGLLYEATSQRGAQLPWAQLKHVEVQPVRPGTPEALMAWPKPDPPLRNDPGPAALWSREIDGFLIPGVRTSFGANPDRVAYAVADITRGAIVPTRAAQGPGPAAPQHSGPPDHVHYNPGTGGR